MKTQQDTMIASMIVLAPSLHASLASRALTHLNQRGIDWRMIHEIHTVHTYVCSGHKVTHNTQQSHTYIHTYTHTRTHTHTRLLSFQTHKHTHTPTGPQEEVHRQEGVFHLPRGAPVPAGQGQRRRGGSVRVRPHPIGGE